MKITQIKQQVKRADRYSIFVDGTYAFSLSESGLLTMGLASGQELDKAQLGELKKASGADKAYGNALRYVAMRPRTKWEISFYLERKNASPTLIESILNKLSNIGLIDDRKVAQAYVNDRRLLRPTSRRKMVAELRKKHVEEEIIEAALGNEAENEQTALVELIARKRKQSKYQDELRLMQYLARQGFSYGDIKQALQQPDD